MGTGETARESRTFQPGEETHGWGTVIFKYLEVCRVDKGIALQSSKQKQPPEATKKRVEGQHQAQPAVTGMPFATVRSNHRKHARTTPGRAPASEATCDEL